MPAHDDAPAASAARHCMLRVRPSACLAFWVVIDLRQLGEHRNGGRHGCWIATGRKRAELAPLILDAEAWGYCFILLPRCLPSLLPSPTMQLSARASVSSGCLARHQRRAAAPIAHLLQRRTTAAAAGSEAGPKQHNDAHAVQHELRLGSIGSVAAMQIMAQRVLCACARAGAWPFQHLITAAGGSQVR